MESKMEHVTFNSGGLALRLVPPLLCDHCLALSLNIGATTVATKKAAIPAMTSGNDEDAASFRSRKIANAEEASRASAVEISANNEHQHEGES